MTTNRRSRFLSLLFLFACSFGSIRPLPGAEPPNVFCLTTCEMPHTEPADPAREDWFVPNLLTREIVRQGVLLAAREAHGVATRDETLREPLSASGEPSRFNFDVRHVQATRVDYVLRQGDRVLLDGSFPYQFGHAHAIEAMQADAVEALSRGDFADALTKAGYTRRKRPYTLDSPLPSEIDAALDRMDLFMQYEAVRLAHRAMDMKGESMALLGALARGYANLGQLTAYHHSTMRHAFAARAVLYATRLIRIKKTSPVGYWHRAYAFTLMGLTKASMFDLEKADEIRKEHDPAAVPPSWLSLVEMANEYDYPGLNAHVRDMGEHLPLAAFLWFRSVEFSNSQALAIEVAKRALEVNPICLRIMHGADRTAGVAYRHMTTAAVFQMFAASALQRIPQIARKEERLAAILAGDPAALEDPLGRAELAQKLIDQTSADQERGEPSLAVLGRLINEEDVLHVGMRAEFLRDSLGTESADFLDEMKPVYREHPLGFLIDSLRLSQGLPAAQYEAIVGDVEVKESNIISSGPFFWRFPNETRFKNMTNGEYNRLRWRHVGTTDVEYQYNISTTKDVAPKVQKAKWMFDMNPHAPYRFVVLIEHDWQASQEHLDEWEERYGHHPAVALALGKQHEAHGNPDKAEEYYAGYIAAVPDYEVYVRLARLYYRRGQKEKMLDVAEGLLEQEDYALNHASMSKLIAYTLMAEGAYDEALPWAERSAESYAAWGLQALADCYEGLGKLEEAHELYQAIDERYGSAMQYEFAARTGHGELDEAWTKKLEILRRYYAADGPEVQLYEAFQRALEGELAEAARKWQAVVETSGDPALALLAAALAVRSSEEEVAKSMLEKIAASEQAAKLEGAPLKELSELLLDVLASEEQTAPPVAKLVRLPASGGAANSHFAVAAFLEAKGNEQRAAEHYREAARWPAREGFSVILSWIRLRELGEDPLKLAPRYAGIEAGIQ